MSDPRVLVVGGGITGLTVAHELAEAGRHVVTLREAAPRLGGKIATSAFAGLAAVDEGADAFLARTPAAVQLAERLGLGDRLTSPTDATAAVWHRGLHPIPDGLLLGVPGSVVPMARSGLLSVRGKLRAAIEPLLPRTPLGADAIGPLVRARFGDEVHERLVDALVGSIYAADTDRFSLGSVPQLDTLARQHRSLLLGARRTRRAAAATPTGPIFAAPLDGMGALVAALARSIDAHGVDVRTSSPVTTIEADGSSWRVDDEIYDQVVLASPGRVTAPLLTAAAPDAASILADSQHAGVILVTLSVPARAWPERLHGRSGYLVPKPVQRYVTAASFGSQKWAHWRPADGSQVLRVSLGRDGLDVGHLDDDTVIRTVVDEVNDHLAIDVQPSATRISRWPDAFPQYRPHHAERVRVLERALPGGVHVAGASHHGIGIPACVASAQKSAERLMQADAPAR
ncbi:MAG: protoporphyrinogen oxidase [Ilumatobacter sp.]|nr:MAG: protoporphyrinogen oxidase [Ilumatobacter sp.]